MMNACRAAHKKRADARLAEYELTNLTPGDYSRASGEIKNHESVESLHRAKL